MALIVNAATVGAPSIGNFQVRDSEQDVVADTDQARRVVVRVAANRHIVAAGVEEGVIRNHDGVSQRNDAVGREKADSESKAPPARRHEEPTIRYGPSGGLAVD